MIRNGKAKQKTEVVHAYLGTYSYHDKSCDLLCVVM